ncbi:hypothetical protein [Brevibacillus dissolubilis]|uniref:hypothetical protein n=1 Tax=Brevibacillus dissolubilis TaxID=1844116 RepID=UPI001115EC82|nr:hypothetical protein [Brevibacillus dissolubilis]
MQNALPSFSAKQKVQRGSPLASRPLSSQQTHKKAGRNKKQKQKAKTKKSPSVLQLGIAN